MKFRKFSIFTQYIQQFNYQGFETAKLSISHNQYALNIRRALGTPWIVLLINAIHPFRGATR